MPDIKGAFEKAGFKAQDKSASQGQPKSGVQNRFKLEDNYSSQADQVIQKLKQEMGRNYQNFTTSKIRNILAMVSEIYNDVMSEKEDNLTPELQSRIEYLKVRLVYECGREPWVVKPFVNKSGILELLDNIGSSRTKFVDFAHYMEALVAYHRFHDGKDK